MKKKKKQLGKTEIVQLKLTKKKRVRDFLDSVRLSAQKKMRDQKGHWIQEGQKDMIIFLREGIYLYIYIYILLFL